MTKRKNLEENPFNKPTGKKRVAFSAPKNAATKALVKQNSLNSPLLRLPLEIRNKIWSEVLGDRLVHFRYLHDDKISFETNEELHAGMHWSPELQEEYGSAWRHVVCQKDCPEAQEDRRCTTSQGYVFLTQSHYDCEEDLGYDPPEPNRIYDEWWRFRHEMMRLSVLRSCRQIYVEANNILWTSNTFSFADPTTFGRFMTTRTINQRRLIRSLRLQVEWAFNYRWKRCLSIALMRSLSALRCLRLNIEYKLMFADNYESAKSHNVLYITDCFTGLKRFSALPLTEVEIFVENPKYEPEDHGWTKVDRQDFAEGLRKMLLNLEGAQIYADTELKWKELRQREREDAAKINATLDSMDNQSLARLSE